MATKREIDKSLWMWLWDDEEIRERLDLEDLLRAGIVAYDGLIDAGRRYRREVARGRVRRDAFREGVLAATLDHWLQNCPAAEARIRELEARGVAVEGADEFRRRYLRASVARVGEEIG